MDQETRIAVSGGFDPVHEGHIDYLADAAKFGKVVVLLNTDEWLMRKKGYVFMPWRERMLVLRSIRYVDDVMMAIDGDNTVIGTFYKYPNYFSYFGKGGDRGPTNTPENEVCEKFGIRMIYGLGGAKKQSSSDLVRNVQKH